MKWIGQLIYDQIARFRDDVYLEDISTGTIASGGNLGLDSNNKIVKATVSSGSGDITSVVAGVGLSGGATSGDATLTVDFSEFSSVSPANGDSLATLDSDGSTEQLTTIANLATLFAGTGLTASSSVISVDADQSGITSLGTLTGLTIDGNKSVTPGDGAMIHVDTCDITDNDTSASGTAAKYTHVNIESPRLLADNASVTTTNAATLYVNGPVAAGANQTITNAWALWVDSGNARFDGNIDLEGDMDVNGTLETDALTIDGTALTSVCSPVAGHASIATVGTIGTGTWQGDVIASAYLDADTAHYSATRQTTLNYFKVSVSSTKYYIGFQEADAESTSDTNKNLPLLSPVSGKLLKVFLRTGGNISSKTLTLTLEHLTTSNNTNSSNLSVVGTQSGNGPTGSSMVTYDFTTGLDSGTNTFSAGDMLFLGFTSDSATGNILFYVTCLWEFDYS